VKKLKSIVYWLLARGGVRRAFEATQRSLSGVVSGGRIRSHAYHSLNPIAFSREQQAVMAGRHSYYQALHHTDRSNVALRRNVHRIEKGLVMQPPRPIFALDYIEETLDFFEATIHRIRAGEPVDQGELEWASAVLGAYFRRVTDAAVKHHAERFAFASAELGESATGEASPEPFLRETSPLAVTFENLHQLAMRRRSVRFFQQRRVPRDLVDRALEIARQSPTACNRMPYEFRFFDDPEMVPKVASVPFGSAGYAENIPMVAVVVGRLDSYFSPRDRHAVYIDSSLAVMGFLYGLETLGLSSSIINWPDFEPLEIKMQKLLGLELHERPMMLIAIGFADTTVPVPFSKKKELDSFRSFNRM